MNRSLLGVFLSLCFFAATSFAQSRPCSLSDDTAYSKKIKEFTTESFFITELVDHLPVSSCVPAPDAALHHIVGAPDVLDYTKDINAFMGGRMMTSNFSRRLWVSRSQGGGGPAGLSAVLRGLPMRGDPRPWKNSDETPNFVAPGLDTTADIRGGLGYQGLANLELFVREGGLLLAVQTSASLPVAGGMTEMVNVSDARAMQAPGSVVLSTIDDKKSPITYGYDDKLYVYFRQGPVIMVGGNFGGPGGGPDENAGAPSRSSGRGTASDPDIIQGRTYEPPEKPVKRSPHEQELYVPEDLPDFARFAIPPKDQQPRVVLRFAAEKDLLLSGMITGGNEIAEKPAVVDVPHGKGHVVLFANNPMWRGETMGSYFLVFNAILNFDHLDAGNAAVTSK
jgi:hypothetical protein